jgi:hypothetical protein
VQLPKQVKPIDSSRQGSETNDNDVHDRNAEDSIRKSRDGGSKVIFAKFAHKEKQSFPITSIDDGITIDARDAQRANNRSENRLTRQTDSNVTF